MEEERISKALARIEAAAQRIEAAASSKAARSNAASVDADLANRHEALRKEARAALADMDRLIGTLES